MTLITRTGKGSKLSILEMDANLVLLNKPQENIIFVNVAADLDGYKIGDVITIPDNRTIFATAGVDLLGARLVCGENVTILGASSENCVISSTGLTDALITSTKTLVIRHISFTAALVFDLDGIGARTALDWTGVNFINCADIGTIKDYTNLVFDKGAFLDSTGLKFTGVIDTVAFNNSFFSSSATGAIISILPTATINRRVRLITSSFVVSGDAVGIDFSESATVPDESYILDTVNFGGNGTYLTGVDVDSNKALFINCFGIENTFVNGQMYFAETNAIETEITTSGEWVKMAGITTPSPDNAKYLHSNNRLTCDAVIQRKYLIHCTLSFAAGNNNVCEFGFYDSKLNAIRLPSITPATANAAGRVENVPLMCVINHSQADYIEIWVRNNSGTANITGTKMNTVITQIG